LISKFKYWKASERRNGLKREGTEKIETEAKSEETWKVCEDKYNGWQKDGKAKPF